MCTYKMKRNVIKASSYIFILSIVAKSIGFLKSMIQASYFGVTVATDAYSMANGVVNDVLYMITTALSVAFVPIYIQKKSQYGLEEAHKIASRVITALSIGAILLIVFLELIAPWFMQAVAPSYSGDLLQETVIYFRVMVIGYVFALVSALYQNLLNAEKRYGFSSVTSIINSFVLIVLILMLAGKIGIWALVISLPVSYLAQFILLYFKGRNYGTLTLRHGVKDDALKNMFVQALPILISQATVEINQVVDRALLSSMEEGVVTAVSYSAVLYQFVVHIISIPISTVMFTELSEAGAERNFDYIKRNLSESFKLIITICLPIILIVVFSANDIVNIVYGRGMFDSNAVEKTALGLMAYIFCVIPVTIKSVLTKAFYALNDTKRPMVIGMLEVGLNIMLSVILSRYLGIMGVVGATAIASTVFAVALIITFNIKHVNVTENIWRKYYKTIVAIVLSCIIVMGIKSVHFSSSLLNFSLRMIIAFISYLGILALLKEPIIYSLFRRVIKKGRKE